MTRSALRYVSAVVVLGFVFGSGFFLGQGAPARIARPGPDLQITRTSLLDALDPSADQRVKLERIMDTARKDADSIMGLLLGEIRVVTQDTEGRMRAVLSTRQNEVLDTLLARPSEGAKMRTRR